MSMNIKNQVNVNNNVKPISDEAKGTVWVDALDKTRFLKAIGQLKDKVVCRVFFAPDDSKKKQDKVFAGTVELPKSLFSFNGNSSFGFNPEGSEPTERKAR